MATNYEQNGLSKYRSTLRASTPLSAAEEVALARAFEKGDQRAGHKLVVACLPFVVSIAMEYRRWGIPVEDIIQQGNIGLLRAASRFDTKRDCRLVTYAAYWIRAEIREYVIRGYRVVRFGTTKSERRALRLYRTTREDDPATLAALSGMTVERVRGLLPLLAARDVSMDAESAATGSTIGDRLASKALSPEDSVAADESNDKARDLLAAAISELTAREQLIVRERWQSEDPVTLERLGVRLGVSKERVRQIEERTKAKLRVRLAELGYEDDRAA